MTDGGGWLVVQRRIHGSEKFHRNWKDYEKGFGSLTGELWYGLRALHCLTQHRKWELRVDFTFSNGTKSFMHYNHFSVGPATDNYRLSILGFTGITPTDPFTAHNINGQPFSTYDKDNSYTILAQSMVMVAQHQVDGGIGVVLESTSITTMEDPEDLYT